MDYYIICVRRARVDVVEYSFIQFIIFCLPNFSVISIITLLFLIKFLQNFLHRHPMIEVKSHFRGCNRTLNINIFNLLSMIELTINCKMINSLQIFNYFETFSASHYHLSIYVNRLIMFTSTFSFILLFFFFIFLCFKLIILTGFTLTSVITDIHLLLFVI